MNLLPAKARIQLYNCADEPNQNFIINSYPDFFGTDPNHDILELLVTQKSTLMVHCILFLSILHVGDVSIQSFSIFPMSGAQDCEHNLSTVYIKDQLIWGMANDVLQAYILAESSITEKLRAKYK